MWSDNETEIDLLQFRYIAKSIVRLTQNTNLLPTTIGVFGDWGSGKSSLLKMVEKEISQDNGILTISFNGWLFEGFEDAKTALMGTILEKIEEKVNADENLVQKAGGLLKKLSRRVNWFQLVGLTARYGLPTLLGMPHLSAANLGVDALGAVVEKAKGMDVEEAKKLLKEAPEGEENIRKNIREFRSDFAEVLEKSEIKTLVVFVDDLDRCMPDTIIETLEAIKLFLFVPGTVFILGADERLIQYAVRRRFPELPGADAEVGRDYLEKLIQIPIRIPALSGAENYSYINLLFAQNKLSQDNFEKVCNSIASGKTNSILEHAFGLERLREIVNPESISKPLERDLDLATQIAPILTPGLGGNPRRTKRFLNTLLLRMQLADDRGLDIDRKLLAKLMLLEYLKPEFFKQLARLQSKQDGVPQELVILEKSLAEFTTETLAKENLEEMQTSAKKQGVKKQENEQILAKEKAQRKNLSITIPSDVQGWLSDPWMEKWLMLEPLMSGIDLRPYFYVAHDSVGSLVTSQVRLSPIARQILDKLLSTSGVSQNLGLQMSKDLDNPDILAIFESLADRIRQSTDLDNSPQKILFKLVGEKPDLIPQTIALYDSLPETKVTIGTVPLLANMVKNTTSESTLLELLERWSKSSSSQPLARAATTMLTKMQSGKKMRSS